MTLSSTRALRSDGASACPDPDRLGEHEKLHVEIWLTRVCVLLTLAAFATFVGLYVPRLESGGVLAAVYLLLVSGLVYGGLVYQVSRLSCLRRVRAHGEGGRSEPASFSDAAVAILVPS